MKCPKCGARLDDYARVCNSCGLQITVEVLRNGYKEKSDSNTQTATTTNNQTGTITQEQINTIMSAKETTEEESLPEAEKEKLAVPVGKVILVIVLSFILFGTIVWLVAQTALPGGMFNKNKPNSSSVSPSYSQTYTVNTGVAN